MNLKALGVLSLTPFLALLCGCGDSKESVEARSPVNFADDEGYAQIQVSVNPNRKVELNRSLSKAVIYSELSEVERLIAEGATPEAADNFGLKVLFNAAHLGKTDVVKVLIKAGADVNDSVKTSFNDDGVGYNGTRAGTPMSYAAEAGKIEVMKTLQAAGADVNGAGPEGNTPLMRAAEAGQLEAVKWLLSQGANAAARNKLNGTAMSVSQMIVNPDPARQEIMQLLKNAQ